MSRPEPEVINTSHLPFRGMAAACEFFASILERMAAEEAQKGGDE